ncbi:Poly [ADP-ribose] polymerase 1, partial [Quaeritorhiza haematococci]
MARERGVDVVDEMWVNDCVEQKKRINPRDTAKYTYLLAENRSARKKKAEEERKEREQEREKRKIDDSKSSLKAYEPPPKKAKLTVKGGLAVDPESDLAGTHHVLQDGPTAEGLKWTCVLSKSDVETGQNSYYKLQLLVPDKTGPNIWSSGITLFRSWGRVGTNRGGSTMDEFGTNVEAAKKEFRRLYKEKSLNEFGAKEFVKKPRGMYPLEMDFGGEDDDDEEGGKSKKSTIKPGSKTKLAKPIVELVKLIFDVEAMKQTLMEMEIDLTKMPLGKISKGQIQLAYG